MQMQQKHPSSQGQMKFYEYGKTWHTRPNSPKLHLGEAQRNQQFGQIRQNHGPQLGIRQGSKSNTNNKWNTKIAEIEIDQDNDVQMDDQIKHDLINLSQGSV